MYNSKLRGAPFGALGRILGPALGAGPRARARGPKGQAGFRVPGSHPLFAGLGPKWPASFLSAERPWPGWVLQLNSYQACAIPQTRNCHLPVSCLFLGEGRSQARSIPSIPCPPLPPPPITFGKRFERHLKQLFNNFIQG